MKVLLSEVLLCIPAKIKVNPNDYAGGMNHPRFGVDLGQAIKWNACVDDMQSNLARLVKQCNARGEGHNHE